MQLYNHSSQLYPLNEPAMKFKIGKKDMRFAFNIRFSCYSGTHMEK